MAKRAWVFTSNHVGDAFLPKDQIQRYFRQGGFFSNRQRKYTSLDSALTHPPRTLFSPWQPTIFKDTYIFPQYIYLACENNEHLLVPFLFPSPIARYLFIAMLCNAWFVKRLNGNYSLYYHLHYPLYRKINTFLFTLESTIQFDASHTFVRYPIAQITFITCFSIDMMK